METDDLPEAHQIFGAPVSYPDHTLAQVSDELTDAGFVVEESGDWAGTMVFHDIGALVYYFKLVPWDVPDDFGVDAYGETMLRLHAATPVRFTKRRFWLRATKPAV